MVPLPAFEQRRGHGKQAAKLSPLGKSLLCRWWQRNNSYKTQIMNNKDSQ